MRAYKAAVQHGIDPETFWRLTPYLTRKAIAGLRDGRITLAWQIAVLSRQKKMPKLDTLIESDPVNVDDKMKALFSAHKRK